jgi:dipeptidyl aminopeptidase/acylaminoacyl peptidase
MKVSAKGGAPERLTTVNAAQGERVHRDPHVLPDGRVLFAVVTERDSRIEAFLPSTGQRRLLADGGNPIYLPTGHLVLARGSTLFAAPLDLQKLELTTQPVPVLGGVRSDSKTYFAVGREGTLTYVPVTSTVSKLVWVDRQGKARAAFDESQPFSHPRLSPDGTRAVLASAGDIWVYELASGTRARIATESSRPIWTADGKRITIQQRRSLYSVPADGSSEPQLMLAPQGSGVAAFPLGWSADGRFLAFSNVTNETSRDIWVLPLGGIPAPFVATPIDERAAMFSPDGRWLIYALKQTGRDEEIYVQAYPGPGGRWLISTGGGMEPVWSRDGTEVFYRTLDGSRMWAVSVRTSPTFSASPPKPLFEDRYARQGGGFYSNYDVSKDGREFLMLEPEQEIADAQLNVILNWFEELKRRVPAGARL